jgi:hypothetical protein
VLVCDSGRVTFAGPTGTLWLDRPSTFTGKVAVFGAQDGIDLPGIPFDLHTTLGYSENSNDTGGILSVKEGTHIAKIALLGNYMPPWPSAAVTKLAAMAHCEILLRKLSGICDLPTGEGEAIFPSPVWMQAIGSLRPIYVSALKVDLVPHLKSAAMGQRGHARA